MSNLSFRRRLTIGQLNAQTAATEKENLYTLSKIIYINSKNTLFLSDVYEIYLKCRQFNWRIPVMDFTFQKICRLGPVTLSKMFSFISIFKVLCSDFKLSLKISLRFRRLYFPEYLWSETSDRSNQFPKYSNLQKSYIQGWWLGVDKTWNT